MDLGQALDYDGAIRSARGQENDSAIPVFFHEAVLDAARTEEAGRQVYQQVEFIKIIIPGDKDEFISRVKDSHRERFPDQYRNFKERGAEMPEGTPLAFWPMMSVAMVAELNAMHVFTIEQLSELTDGVIEKMGGRWAHVRDNALRFLESKPALDTQAALTTKENALIGEMRAQIEQLTKDNEALKTHNEKLEMDVDLWRGEVRKARSESKRQASRASSAKRVAASAKAKANDTQDGFAERCD